MIKLGASILAVSAALGLCGTAIAGQDLLWEVEQPQATFYGTEYSMVYDTSFGSYDAEVADDFEATGTIQQITIPGHGCGQCSPMDVDGVFVRIYEWSDSGPGELQHERFVSTGNGFDWDGLNPFSLYITLNDPIPVDGWHFISVQVAFGDTGGVWYFKQSNRFNHINQPIHYRDNLDGGGWAQHEDFQGLSQADFAISIYGQPGPTTPSIDGIDRPTVTSSDRIVVNGDGFGSPGNGELRVNGVPGIVTSWSSTQIIGYVPEGVTPGEAELTVVNLGVESDALPITIIPREPNGRVKWVFEAVGDYVTFPPAIGPDGTTYFDDVDGNLYAVSDDGALLWIVDSLLGQEGGGNEGPVNVGEDGTIYVGTNPLGPTVEIVAFNPDGTHKWTFTAPHALTWVAGPNVGPDGDIYGVLNGPQAYGETYDVVALETDGTVKWTSAADPLVFEYAASGFELAFAPTSPGGPVDQLLFTADLFGFEVFGRVWSFDIADGSQNFAEEMNPAGPGTTLGNCQIASTTSTGDFYGFEFNGVGGGGFGLQAFDANGDRTWHFDPDIASGVTHPAVGPDGTIYFGWDLGRLTAVSPNGEEIWTNFEPVIYNGPMPSPTAPMLLALARESYGDVPSFMEARHTDDGELLWSQTLVDDEGDLVGVYSRPRFTPDGQSAYFSALELPITPTSTFRIFAIDTSDDEETIPGDIDGDGAVNVADLLTLLGVWGACDDSPCPADLDNDGTVNVTDLLILLANWS